VPDIDFFERLYSGLLVYVKIDIEIDTYTNLFCGIGFFERGPQCEGREDENKIGRYLKTCELDNLIECRGCEGTSEVQERSDEKKIGGALEGLKA